MEVKILGTGCPKCKTLEKLVRNVVEREKINASISKVDDVMKIMEYGVMHTPALVIDEKVIFSGRIPSEKELEKFLTQKS